MYFISKTKRPILWSSIEDILTKTLQLILEHLQVKYTTDKEAIVYFCINQNNLTTGIRSSPHVLNQNSLHNMVDHVMATFHHYVNSNQSVALNETFEIFFKVLSGVHVAHVPNRRTAVPLRSTVGAWPTDNSSCYEAGGIINLPDLSTFDSFFANQCVLLCFIYMYLKVTKTTMANALKRFVSKNATLTQLQRLITIFKDNITQFCEITREPLLGPRNLERTAELFAAHNACQVIVIRSMEGSSPDVLLCPAHLDFTLPRIYCYLRDSHLVCIDNLQAFFRKMKRKICFGCKRFFAFRFKPRTHKCPQLKSCAFCYGIIEQPSFIISPMERLTFCDSANPSVNFRHILCRDRCRNIFKTQKCFDNHWDRCRSNDMPAYCNKCKTMIGRGKKSFNEALKEHICGVRISKCMICFKHAPLNHSCPILKVEKTKEWPILAILCMTFKANQASETCNDCFALQVDFGKKTNLTLPELCKHPKFSSILCPYHLESRNGNNSANIIGVWIERARFIFENKMFLDDELGLSCPVDKVLRPYCDQNSAQQYTVGKFREISKNLKRILSASYVTAEKKFFQFLISGHCQNVCFLVESNELMVKVLALLLSFHIEPKVFQKGSKFFALELKELGIKFLNFSNYVQGGLSDWVKQFGITTLVPYVPQKLNQNLFLSSDQPLQVQFDIFKEFGDSEEVLKHKRAYFETLSFPINSVKQLFLESLQSKCALFLQIVTNYLRHCFDIQSLVARACSNSEASPLHPFSGHIISSPSFVMQLFQFFYLNLYDVCTIKNPYNVISARVSAGEHEYTSFLAWKNPHLQIKNALNCIPGELSFNKVIVDAYSPVSKCVYQYNGCYTHKHERSLCLNQRLVEKNAAECEKKRKADRDINESLLQKFPMTVKSVSVMFECEWFQYKATHPEEMASFQRESGYSPNRSLTRLNSRASVRGGFLEVYKLKYLASDKNEISFVDCNSLYSHIALTCNLPLGGFETLLSADLQNNVNLVNGMFFYQDQSMECDVAHVQVLCPANLKRPFLSFRVNDEYVFYANCHKCARQKLTKPCKHNDEDRSFQSTWTCRELAYACSKLKYKVLRWYEVHHFKESKPVLSDFVKIFASQKLKSSNILKGLSTETEREQYCKDMNEIMNFDNLLQLSPANCSDNVSSKNYFKNCLNSLFGRFSLHTEQVHHQFCRNLHEIQVIASNPTNTIVDLFSVGDDVIEVLYINRPTVQANRRSNLYFTALINAQARIFIYDLSKQLADLGCDILSIDTDSICFAHCKNFKYPFSVNDAFGSFKHVLGTRTKIDAFYSMGVRSYIMVYTDSEGRQDYITKVKGMSLQSHNTSKSITPQLFCEFIEKRFDDEIASVFVPQSRARLNKQTKSFARLISAHEFSNELHVRRFILKNDCTYATYSYGYDFKDVNSVS